MVKIQSLAGFKLQICGVGRDHHVHCATTSVTRFGDLLDFGALFKAFGNN